MTLTLIPAPPAVDTGDLRHAASRLSSAAQRYESAVRRLSTRVAALPDLWRGAAASAWLTDLEDLQRRALTAAEAHAEAAGVLVVCAARVEDAQHIWSRAELLSRGDEPEPAERLAAQARSAVQEALAQATAALLELASRAPQVEPDGLTMRDQVTGFGRGAVDAVWGSVTTAVGLSLPRMLADRDGWLEDVRGLRDGVAYAVGHPREASKAAIGWDLLADGRYGEWAGGFAPDLLSGAVTGGALPTGRRAADVADDLGELAEDVDDLQRVHGRHSNAGGPVAQGPHLPTGYAAVIRNLTPQRRRHILDGDETGGGHRHSTGRPCKTEFPAAWSDDDIIRRVMDTARRPQSAVWQPDKGTFVVVAEHAGVTVTAIVDEHGSVVTGYPKKGGRGVVRNPC